MRRNLISAAIAVAVVVVLALLAGFVLDLLGFNPGLAFGRTFARGLEFWTRLLILVAICGLLVLIGVVGPWGRPDSWVGSGFGVLAVLVFLVGGFFLVGRPMNRRMHDIRHERIISALIVEDAPAVGYRPRLPYPVAEAQLRRGIGDVPGVSLTGVWRFPVAEKAGTVFKTCGLVLPDRNAWKRPVNRVVCTADDGTVESAQFAGQVPSPNAMFKGLRLVDDVNQRLPGAVYSESDLYGYIRDGQPYMVVPGRAFTDWWRPVSVWAGAVVYGPDAKATVHKEATDDPTSPHYVPGPVIGESTADELLNALNDRGGFLQARKAEFAYDTADGSNVRNFALERTDGAGMRLVTQLTPRGASQTPTAVLEVNMASIKAGEWPKGTLRRLPPPEGGRPRAADSEVRDRINQVYGASLDLANRQLSLLEITPGPEPDVVITTIGSANQVTGRVETNRVTREMCVYTARGVEVRCDPGDVTPRSRNALDAMFADDQPESEQGAVPATGPAGVEGLTTAELVRQIDALVQELKRRNP